MESKFDIENFESFLKERSDAFRMYPSKRVWYSVYNNMHPGKLLPSFSMILILIASIYMVGYMNTNYSLPQVNDITLLSKSSNENVFPKKVETPNAFLSNQLFSINSNSSDDVNNSSKQQQFQQQDKFFQLNVLVHSGHFDGEQTTAKNATLKFTPHHYTLSGKPSSVLIKITNAAIADIASDLLIASSNTTASPIDNGKLNQKKEVVDGNTAYQNIIIDKDFENEMTGVFSKTVVGLDKIISVKADQESIKDELQNSNLINNLTANKAISNADKSWIEQYALYNKLAAPKWKGKLSWQAYIAPSVVYRTLINNATDKNPVVNAAFSSSYNNEDLNSTVNHTASFGIEAGAGLQYSLLKNLRVKASLQLNYSRYTVNAFENYHPIATSITLNSTDNQSTYEVYRTTPFSNKYGLSPVKLHNESYQLSIPIGADLRLARFDGFDWYAGVSIQPTIVVYGNNFIISTDRRNYVNESIILNRFNLNAGFETYISYKKNNYTWQVGPQFRTQLFSTNSKVYSVEERLNNYGLKIGISKKL